MTVIKKMKPAGKNSIKDNHKSSGNSKSKVLTPGNTVTGQTLVVPDRDKDKPKK